MSSVAQIEVAIQQLSVADQRTIARHLRQRLQPRKRSSGLAPDNEGIRFLPPVDTGTAEQDAPRRDARRRS